MARKHTKKARHQSRRHRRHRYCHTRKHRGGRGAFTTGATQVASQSTPAFF